MSTFRCSIDYYKCHTNGQDALEYIRSTVEYNQAVADAIETLQKRGWKVVCVAMTQIYMEKEAASMGAIDLDFAGLSLDVKGTINRVDATVQHVPAEHHHQVFLGLRACGSLGELIALLRNKADEFEQWAKLDYKLQRINSDGQMVYHVPGHEVEVNMIGDEVEDGEDLSCPLCYDEEDGEDENDDNE